MTFQMIGGDTSSVNEVVNQVNQNIAQLKAQDVTNIFKDDTGTRRVLLGKGKDGFYGLKVSQPGVDVYDGEDTEMSFNSDNNVFKIVQSGTLSINASTGGGTFATIDHNLGYVPVVFATCKSPGFTASNRAMVPYIQVGAGDAYTVYCQISNVRTDVVQFEVWLGSSATGDAGTWEIKYWIMAESAN